MSEKISVVINTYNAEAQFRRVLDSVRDFDEVVVCDMESTGRHRGDSQRIRLPCGYLSKGEHKICEPARDFRCTQQCRRCLLSTPMKWCLRRLRCYLYERIAEPGFGSALPWPGQNLFMGRPETSSPDYQLRFFQRDKCTWPPTIHSRPDIDGPVENIPASRRDLYLIHLTTRR